MESERSKARTIGVDRDVVNDLQKITEELTIKLGFKPSLNQVVKYLINIYHNQG